MMNAALLARFLQSSTRGSSRRGLSRAVLRRTLTCALGGLALLGGLSACDDTSDTVAVNLCSPVISRLEIPTDAGEASALSTAGGTIRVHGKHFWTFFSATTEPGVEPFPDSSLFDLTVRVGGSSAQVREAWEETLDVPGEADLSGEGESLSSSPLPSSCETCSACVEANATGCGECQNECAGCEQVLEVYVPLLPASSAPSDLEPLQVPVVVTSGLGFTEPSWLELVLACEDGVDNDGDGLTDGADLPCLLSTWSEVEGCADGIDNDGDGWVDLEDAACLASPAGLEAAPCADGLDNDGDGRIDLEDGACAGEPRGLSELSTVAPPACDDGLDNDGDGVKDVVDPQCTTGTDTDESAL